MQPLFTAAENPDRKPLPRSIPFAVTVLMALLYVVTMATQWGDTTDYVDNILEASRTGKIGLLFDFGHTLWRPMGLAIYHVLPRSAFGWSPAFAGHIAFVLPALLGGLFCCWLLARIAQRISRREWIPLLVAGALICSNAFLNWSQAGASYIPGLAFLLGAVWLLLRGPDGEDFVRGGLNSRRIILSGFCLALAILFWFPYLTASAGVAAVLLLVYDAPWPARLRQFLLLAGTTLAVVVFAGIIALRLNGISTPTEAASWAGGASHGMHSASVARFLFGLPRSFVDMGHDGILFKRYLLHDPYAKVTRAQLATTTVLRLILFYGFFAIVLFRLVRDRQGRTVLAILAAAALPLFYFAIVLFESGSTERYLPLFPFLALALAWVLENTSQTSGTTSGFLVSAMAALLAITAVTQVWNLARFRVGGEDNRVAESVKTLPADHMLLWVPTTFDPLVVLATSRPFHPLNKVRPFPVRQVILLGSDRSSIWRQEFAEVSLANMDAGRQVFISNRLLAKAPELDWNWTEGDVPGVRWCDLPNFFSTLEYSHVTAPGSDGFSELASTEGNREKLRSQLRPNAKVNAPTSTFGYPG